MAESWPNRFCPNAIDFYLQKNTARYPSPLVKSVQTLDRPGRRWIAKLIIKGKGRSFGQKLDALLDRGSTFLIHDWRRPRPLNGLIAGVQTVGAHVRGNTSIAVDGLPASQTHLVDGDYLGLDGFLYRLVSDVLANGAGQGTLSLNRGLMDDLADNSALTLARPTCEMFIPSDDATSSMVDANGFHEYEIPFEEAISAS